MAKTEIHAAPRSGARSMISPIRSPVGYSAAPINPKKSATASARASTTTLKKRRRTLAPSNLFGVSLKIRTCFSEAEYTALAGGRAHPKRRFGAEETRGVVRSLEADDDGARHPEQE
jgi:hypothetical protein